MQKMTKFWDDYKNGRITTLCEFIEAVTKERHGSDETGFERFLGNMPDIAIGDAPKRLENLNFMSDEAMLRYHTRADWQQTDPRIQKFAAHLVEQLRKRKIPVYVHSAFRTMSEQNQLQAKGRSNASWPFASHCQGKAVDIVHGRYHWQMTTGEWAYIGKLGKEIAVKLNIPITWGGDWSFYDPAHWELSDWKQDVRDTYELEPVTLTPRKLLQLNR